MDELLPVQNIPPDRLDENRQKEAIIWISLPTFFSTCIVFVRIYARAIVIRQIGWDDLVITIAMVLTWMFLPVSLMVIKTGAGRHLVAVLRDEPSSLDRLTLWMTILSAIWSANLTVCRISGILFYARLNTMPRFVLYLRFAFIFVVAVLISQIAVTSIRCLPLNTLWQAERMKRCFGAEVMGYNTAVTLIADIVILLLPTHILLSIKATWERKLVLGIIMGFGIFAILTSVGRIVAVFRTLNHLDDMTWHMSRVLLWSCSEACAAIFALSLPALKGLFSLKLHHRPSEPRRTDYHPDNIPLSQAVDPTGQDIPTAPNPYLKVGTRQNGDNASQERLWP